jgi:hypothetical protein
MTTYRCDENFYDHVKRVDPDPQPAFHKVASYDVDSLWLRPVEQQVSEEIELYRDEFRMILDDLIALPSDRPIIAEGAALMPEFVDPLRIDHGKMIWMVPTERFQRTHYELRDWRHDVLSACSDPNRGWENWMARDAAFAREVARQAHASSLELVIVDGSRSIDDNEAIVRAHFGLARR